VECLPFPGLQDSKISPVAILSYLDWILLNCDQWLKPGAFKNHVSKSSSTNYFQVKKKTCRKQVGYDRIFGVDIVINRIIKVFRQGIKLRIDCWFCIYNTPWIDLLLWTQSLSSQWIWKNPVQAPFNKNLRILHFKIKGRSNIGGDGLSFWSIYAFYKKKKKLTFFNVFKSF